eukprot:scaffold5208_cov154-Isochrysis_galbana.AAC.1
MDARRLSRNSRVFNLPFTRSKNVSTDSSVPFGGSGRKVQILRVRGSDALGAASGADGSAEPSLSGSARSTLLTGARHQGHQGGRCPRCISSQKCLAAHSSHVAWCLHGKQRTSRQWEEHVQQSSLAVVTRITRLATHRLL